MADRLIFYPQLESGYGIPYHRTHIGRLERDGQFPRRVELTPGGRVAWRESEVLAWLGERAHKVVGSQPERLAKARKVLPLDEIPPGMLRCDCGELFARTVGRPPKRCPACRGGAK